MQNTRTQLIDTLSQTGQTLADLTSGLTDTVLDFRPAPDEWTIREILAHLVDDEMYVMRTRLERMIKEDQPHLAPHDEKKWFADRNKNRDRLSELLEDFRLQRGASLAIFNMLREKDWQRQGYQPEYGTFTAEKWLTHWVEHDRVHIEQIRRLITACQTA
jgi:hypothetical protein